MRNSTRSYSTCSQYIGAEPGRVFPLLCPVREYEWIEYWRGKLIYSNSGFAEKDCVFKSKVFENIGVETWTCSHYDPPRRIEYVRMSEHTVIRLEIVLEPADIGTLLKSALVVTSLDQEGEAILREFDASSSEKHNKPAWIMLHHYLTTGQMLPQREAVAMATGAA